jgi:cephalosporin-C deacetylase
MDRCFLKNDGALDLIYPDEWREKQWKDRRAAKVEELLKSRFMNDIQHDYSFDPTYGYDLKKLLRVRAPEHEPKDFDAFWKDLYQRTLKTPLDLERGCEVTPAAIKKIKKHNFKDHDVEIVRFSTLDGVRVGAYLMTPKSGKVNQLLVKGHGYGGRDEPEAPLDPNTAALNPLAPGFHLSPWGDIPYNNCNAHVNHGLESKDTYVFRVCVAAWWSAASAMLELFPEAADRLVYNGWSYGGGIGCLMLPWDERYRGAELGQVSFCQIPIRLTCPCVGSGQSTATYVEQHPKAIQTLAYFDAAFAAKRIRVPTVFACSLFDPAVPPPGQVCAYNVCSAPKRLSLFTVGHFDLHHAESDLEVEQHHMNLKELGLWR